LADVPVLVRLVLAAAIGLGDAPSANEDPASLYKTANQQREADDLAGAARSYARAHRLLRERNPDHPNVPDSLFEALELAMKAHARAPNVPLLCEVGDLYRNYAASLAARDQPTPPDVAERGDALTAELARADARCATDPETPPPAPAPTARPEGPRPTEPAPPLQADPRARKLRHGGYAGLGVAGLGLVVLVAGAGAGARAEAVGRREVAEAPGTTAADLQDGAIARGRVANGLLIAGATLAGAALLAAFGLLVASRRVGRDATRRRAGLDVVIRF
jgi:hypothetical protein